MFSKIKSWFNRTKSVTKMALNQDTLDKCVSLITDLVDISTKIVDIVNDFKALINRAKEEDYNG